MPTGLFESVLQRVGASASLITGDAVIYADAQAPTLLQKPDTNSDQSQRPMEVAETAADKSGDVSAIMILINAILRR